MPSVTEVSDLYTNFMRNPPPRGTEGVCDTCGTFCTGYSRCVACARASGLLEAVLAISLSEAQGQLHTALKGYKRDERHEVHHRFRVELTAVLWRFIVAHEDCVARAAGVDAFPIVTTVPSSSQQRDEQHPLRTIVGRWTKPLAGRYRRILRRSDAPAPEHRFHADKFDAVEHLDGEPVLLIDDMWTTGGNAESAAVALLRAGAGPVAAVAIGRYVNPEFRDNRERLARLPRLFDWDSCWHHHG